MSNIQIYYYCNDRIRDKLIKDGIDLDTTVPIGDKRIDEIYNEIKQDPYFCREEESISYSHFLGLLRNDINLYAGMDDKIVGALNFIFNFKDGENIINFNGICSPLKYSGQCIGEKLINTLIRIAKQNNIKYIYLSCKGDIMEYYRNKFRFEIIEEKKYYDSDEDSDDDEEKLSYYSMRLDLSKVSGGKIHKKNKSKKRNIKNKKIVSTRKRRKLRKF